MVRDMKHVKEFIKGQLEERVEGEWISKESSIIINKHNDLIINILSISLLDKLTKQNMSFDNITLDKLLDNSDELITKLDILIEESRDILC